MDCKKALTESAGDVDQAIEILRKKQGKRIEDRGERVASEGTVQTYIHSNAKVGVLIEVNCETDFVARNDDFVAFARDIALHVAAANPLFVTEDEVDPAARDREAKLFEEQAADKPENIRPKIVEGQIKKWLSRSCCSTRSTSTATSTRARRSSSCRTRSPPRPARTSRSAASRASPSAP
jgi:elongation factor Ts